MGLSWYLCKFKAFFSRGDSTFLVCFYYILTGDEESDIFELLSFSFKSTILRKGLLSWFNGGATVVTAAFLGDSGSNVLSWLVILQSGEYDGSLVSLITLI